MPPGVDGMSGKTYNGFAHGVGGIVYFLAEYARRFRDTSAENAWQSGIDWLMKQASSTDNGSVLEWSFTSDSDNRQWKWC